MDEKLKKFSRDVSLERFISHSTNGAITLSEASEEQLRPQNNQWSCGILWGNDEIKGLIILKFTTLNVLAMGSNVFESTNDNMLFTYTKDFMKEYCNLYAGYIKGTFNNQKIPVGISLPILSDSFTLDACLGFEKSEGIHDQWSLNSNESNFIVQSFMKIEDTFKRYNLDFLEEKKTEQKKANIEFF